MPRWDDEGRANSQIQILRQDANRQLVMVKQKQVLRFRFIPRCVDGVPQPWRHSAAPNGVDDFVRLEDVILYRGTRVPITMLDRVSDQHDRFPDTPYRKMGNVFWSADEKERWHHVIADQSNEELKRKGVTFSQTMALGQCVIYQRNRPVHPPQAMVVLFKSSAKGALAQMFNSLPAGVTQMPQDIINGFALGNVLDPDRGPVITLTDTETAGNLPDSNLVQFAASQNRGGGNWGGGGSAVATFVCLWDQVSSAPLPNETAAQLWVPWDDLLWIPTRAEAWAQLARGFGNDAVAYAAKDEWDNLPEHVKQAPETAAAFARCGVPLPGTTTTSVPAPAAPAPVAPAPTAPAIPPVNTGAQSVPAPAPAGAQAAPAPAPPAPEAPGQIAGGPSMPPPAAPAAPVAPQTAAPAAPAAPQTAAPAPAAPAPAPAIPEAVGGTQAAPTTYAAPTVPGASPAGRPPQAPAPSPQQPQTAAAGVAPPDPSAAAPSAANPADELANMLNNSGGQAAAETPAPTPPPAAG